MKVIVQIGVAALLAMAASLPGAFGVSPDARDQAKKKVKTLVAPTVKRPTGRPSGVITKPIANHLIPRAKTTRLLSLRDPSRHANAEAPASPSGAPKVHADTMKLATEVEATWTSELEVHSSLELKKGVRADARGDAYHVYAVSMREAKAEYDQPDGTWEEWLEWNKLMIKAGKKLAEDLAKPLPQETQGIKDAYDVYIESIRNTPKTWPKSSEDQDKAAQQLAENLAKALPENEKAQALTKMSASWPNVDTNQTKMTAYWPIVYLAMSAYWPSYPNVATLDKWSISEAFKKFKDQIEGVDRSKLLPGQQPKWLPEYFAELIDLVRA